jgi:hypothetical protein
MNCIHTKQLVEIIVPNSHLSTPKSSKAAIKELMDKTTTAPGLPAADMRNLITILHVADLINHILPRKTQPEEYLRKRGGRPAINKYV